MARTILDEATEAVTDAFEAAYDGGLLLSSRDAAAVVLTVAADRLRAEADAYERLTTPVPMPATVLRAAVDLLTEEADRQYPYRLPTRTTPGPAVPLIERAADILIEAMKQPHTAPYHWAGALWEAGMLSTPSDMFREGTAVDSTHPRPQATPLGRIRRFARRLLRVNETGDA